MTPLLQVKNLNKGYSTSKGVFHALRDVSFDLFSGETLGLVGESGCGKSTTARCLLRLEKPTSGNILYNGEDIHGFKNRELLQFRKQAQLIFQDPYGALNPKMTAGNNIAEPLFIHGLTSNHNKRAQVAELLDIVGLCRTSIDKYPYEFSGGQRQRIVIARALALKPKLMICDEPISSLDVSIQAQIINLLKSLQKEWQITYLFIAHDLTMIKYFSDRVAVMHEGSIVECNKTELIFQNPLHPHTKELMESVF
jgi:oligopeptide transport system ATP-binding protein